MSGFPSGNRRSIARPRLSIEDIEIIDADCAVENFTNCIRDVHSKNDFN
jgi:hypothetical protein